MKLVKQSVEIVDEIDGVFILKKLERIGRICYNSESKITDDSYKTFISNILLRGHESVLEHFNITIKWITDRGVSHELVRHRLASYSQQSTRYCNYSNKDMEFISPVDFQLNELQLQFLRKCEIEYNEAINRFKLSPQQARYFLPNGLKTEIIFTMNLRELRHMLDLRCNSSAHPQIKSIAKETLCLLYNKIPIIFDDLYGKYFVKEIKNES